jgi:hypothetical protein
MPKDSADNTAPLIRLHITPLTAELLPTYLTTAQLQLTSDASYHTLLTFPDRPYGYVTLPRMEADKVKKKLHGSILKGNKIRVEEAKPLKKRKAEDDEVAEGVEKAEKGKKPKRIKLEDGVLDGIELPDGRKVKRGWTEPETTRKPKRDKKEKKDKKARKAEKSKYTKEPEMLFKTVLTPTAATENASAKTSKKEKRKSKKDREVVVHEFEKTKKHANFLKVPKKDSTTKTASGYVEGKGWVDEDGNVVEEAKTRRVRDVMPLSYSIGDDDGNTPKSKEGKRSKGKSKSTNSAVGGDNSLQTVSKQSTEPKIEPTIEVSPQPQQSKVPSSPLLSSASAPAPAHSSTIPTSFTPPKTPHPLEAIYKRSPNRPTSIDISTAFSFFGANRENGSDDELDGEEADEDNESSRRTAWPRYTRSGAPTPDTAVASRRFSFSQGVVDMDDEEDSDEGESAGKQKPLGRVDEEDAGDDGDVGNSAGDGATAPGEDDEKGDREESAFAKWFWENRGDNNRTWKRMRRESMKEKRNRENRRIGRRIV